jgi:hypothetical protein
MSDVINLEPVPAKDDDFNFTIIAEEEYDD